MEMEPPGAVFMVLKGGKKIADAEEAKMACHKNGEDR